MRLDRKSIALTACLAFLLSSCIEIPTTETPNDKQEEGRGQEGNPGNPDDVPQPVTFTYFAFLAEDNPELESDIVCNNLGEKNLVMIPSSAIELPCRLKARFDVTNGSLVYNGDELKSGEGEIYCSTSQPAQIKIVGKDNKASYYSMSILPYTGLPVVEMYCEKGVTSNWVDATLIFHGAGQYPDTPAAKVTIKKRGNSTALYPKKAFNVKYEKKTSVFGMKKGKRWCFLANYRDHTLLRNEIAFEMGRMAEGLEWTPHTVMADVVINGVPQGTYEIAEAIRQGKNRVGIEKLNEEDTDDELISGGYLLEVDDHYKQANKFRTQLKEWPVNIRYPDDNDLNSNQFDYIKTFFNEAEEALVNKDFKKAQECFDYPSFIDMLIIEQVMGNAEYCFGGSTYCYKKRNGKLYAGPIWDFEHQSLISTHEEDAYKVLWNKYLLKDPDFVAALKARWPVLKDRFENHIFDYIKTQKKYLEISAEYNDIINPLTEKDYNNQDEQLSFSDAVDRLSRVLAERIQITDDVINSL